MTSPVRESDELVAGNGIPTGYGMMPTPVALIGVLHIWFMSGFRRTLWPLSTGKARRADGSHVSSALVSTMCHQTEPVETLFVAGQSKWVSEKIIMLASQRGVPTTIFRPGYITGDSHTGGVSSYISLLQRCICSWSIVSLWGHLTLATLPCTPL